MPLNDVYTVGLGCTFEGIEDLKGLHSALRQSAPSFEFRILQDEEGSADSEDRLARLREECARCEIFVFALGARWSSFDVKAIREITDQVSRVSAPLLLLVKRSAPGAPSSIESNVPAIVRPTLANPHYVYIEYQHVSSDLIVKVALALAEARRKLHLALDPLPPPPPIWGKFPHIGSARSGPGETSAEPVEGPSTDAGAVYPVWFATNRKPKQLSAGFLPERGDDLVRGRVEVLIPEAHRFAETGTSFWTRLLRFDLRDDRLRVQDVVRLERGAFYGEIQAVMAAASDAGTETHALIFVHGYNVSFEEAAIRAAQIGFDLKVQGATALFSWPSCGRVDGYAADEASIEASEVHIKDFLIEFGENSGASKIHLVAHSMGNRGLLRALQRVASRAQESSKLRFTQIFLAAPDVDRDLFIDLASVFRDHAARTTLYASAHDLPVFLSQKFHGAPRAGYVPPYTVVEGVDTIEVPDFNIDLLGHSYFAQAEALLHDMFDLMRHDASPPQRQRIEQASYGPQTFWKFRR